LESHESEKYRVKLDVFEGPFDLLLYLVQNSKINISQLSISEITRQFMDFIHNNSTINLEELSNFIFTTSILLYLKSRTLIPQEIILDEESRDERREYIDNLIEYQKYKNVAQILKKSLDESKILIRRDTQLILDFRDNENWQEISIMELITAFSRVAREIDRSVFKALELEEISIDEKIDEILDALIDNKTLLFSELFPLNCSKYVLIVIFLALLELVKMKKIYILQHKLFGSIKIIKREEHDFGTEQSNPDF